MLDNNYDKGSPAAESGGGDGRSAMRVFVFETVLNSMAE
jgi:hypothetical protein